MSGCGPAGARNDKTQPVAADAGQADASQDAAGQADAGQTDAGQDAAEAGPADVGQDAAEAGSQESAGDDPAGDTAPTSSPALSLQPTPSTTKKRTLPPGAVVTAQPIVPRIEYFRVKRKPECRSVKDGAVTEGAPAILEWKVTGADKIQLSVDGPGLYAEYGPAGSDSLPFPCEAAPGTYQSHTYTLTAFGLGRNKDRTLVVKALAG
ncbi:hypothetical protein [Actinoplanes sp. GCM10030250]|uniref:hypothetical protein n=1 Tax=Actinoplanes sp. GCM10030250 TaxID=3273376 RepID=UPI0036164481